METVSPFNLTLNVAFSGVSELDGSLMPLVPGRNVLCRGGSEADTKDFGPAGLDRRFSSGCGRRSLTHRGRRRPIFARDFHGPIGAMRGGAGCAGDADASRLGEQEIFSMSR